MDSNSRFSPESHEYLKTWKSCIKKAFRFLYTGTPMTYLRLVIGNFHVNLQIFCTLYIREKAISMKAILTALCWAYIVV